eukprot:748121-Hanusia_phi.AAC.4
MERAEPKAAGRGDQRRRQARVEEMEVEERGLPSYLTRYQDEDHDERVAQVVKHDSDGVGECRHGC